MDVGLALLAAHELVELGRELAELLALRALRSPVCSSASAERLMQQDAGRRDRPR